MLSLSRNCHITVVTVTHYCLSLSHPYRGDRDRMGNTNLVATTYVGQIYLAHPHNPYVQGPPNRGAPQRIPAGGSITEADCAGATRSISNALSKNIRHTRAS